MTLRGTIHEKCKDDRGYYDACYNLFRYTKNIKKLFHIYKYKKAYQVQRVFEILLNQYVAKDPFLSIHYLKEQVESLIFVPVPMSKVKLNERRFSPAYEFSLLLGRILYRTHGIKGYVLPDLFLKKKDTEAQMKRNRTKRLVSLQGVFEINPEALEELAVWEPKKSFAVCIVDDVHTTGATATVLIEVLTKALGTRRQEVKIFFLSLAKS